jgi:hypothetical protein
MNNYVSVRKVMGSLPLSPEHKHCHTTAANVITTMATEGLRGG